MAGRALPDLRPAHPRDLVAAWRERGNELNELAAKYRRDGDPEDAVDLEETARDYFFDADRLEEEITA